MNDQSIAAALLDAGGQQHRDHRRALAAKDVVEEELVPDEDDVEDERRDQPRLHLRQHDPEDGVQARAAVDQRRLVVTKRDAVEESFENPERKGDAEHGVEEDHAVERLGPAERGVHQEDRQHDGRRRHHPRREQQEHDEVGAGRPVAGEGIGGQERDHQCDQHRADREDEAHPQVVEEVGIPDDARCCPVGWKRKTGCRRDDLAGRLEGRQEDPEHREKKDERDQPEQEVIEALPPGMCAHFSCARVSR